MELPKRKVNRIKEFDYSSEGAYYVTICTSDRKCTLSKIVGDGLPVPKKTMLGTKTAQVIDIISQKYPSVKVDKYVIMPNHIHMILMFSKGSSGTEDPSPTLGNVIGWLKYTVTKEYNALLDSHSKIFQRSYYDHIIRGEKDYLEIYEYIENNPAKWIEDEMYSND